MNILTLENIEKVYTERKLFDKASFYLAEGEKVGIIGINGTGKSTLLKIMAGLEEPDAGNVVRANQTVVRYLPQHPQFLDTDTVLTSVMKGIHENGNEKIAHEHDFEYATLLSEAKAMMMRLGISDFEQPTGQLSGGQKKRLALVSVLIRPADILILDEPTNHLDHEMADWLEEVLQKWRGALVMVTHDRYFLDSVTSRIVEIDKGQIYSYDTNYSGYLQRKAEREEIDQASERKRQSILRTELAWMQRGARARSTKQKARIERYEELKGKSAPALDGKVEMSSISTRLGKTTVELEDICKSYGDKTLISHFTYIFRKNDRVGFLGSNGCGKTTLMKILTKREEPDSGELIIGQTVKIGYYTQEIEMTPQKGDLAYMDPEQKVIDYIKNTAEYVKTKDGSISASQMLERFLFPAGQQYSPIGKLSGGEKRRLNLLRVLMEAPNVLVLDEPTNDLDITTLTILEDYLDNFDGIVIIVSHDRYFLDRTVQRIFAFEGEGVLKQYEGGYSDYALRKEMESPEMIKEQAKKQEQTAEGEEQTKQNGKPRQHKLKFSYQEQKDYDTIEADIAALEEEIEQCDVGMLTCASDFVKLNDLTAKKQAATARLEEKMDRWMYLEDLMERIQAE